MYTVDEGLMSLSTYSLEDNRHLARLHRRRRRRRAYAPTSNTASRDNHEKITSWVSFSFLYGYGAPLGGPRSSANISYIFEYLKLILAEYNLAWKNVFKTDDRKIYIKLLAKKKNPSILISDKCTIQK